MKKRTRPRDTSRALDVVHPAPPNCAGSEDVSVHIWSPDPNAHHSDDDQICINCRARLFGLPCSDPPEKLEKNPAAVALGRLGGLKGGKARAASMTPKSRAESARKAAVARWAKNGTTEQDEGKK